LKIYNSTIETKDEKQDIIGDILFNDLVISDKMIKLINSYKKIKLMNNGFEEIIIRILEKYGYDTHLPRKGDVNERFDMFSENSEGEMIIIEVEIPSVSILDAPRNQLDNLAVFNSRRGHDLKKLIPVIICWDLPNKRSDYWNVIEDIFKITGIKIETLTLLSLAVIFWTNHHLDFESGTFFLSNNQSELKYIVDILEQENVSLEQFAGFFSPLK